MFIDRNGTPFVAYPDHGNGDKASVMKFDGTAWVSVGNPGFSDDVVSNIELAVDDSGIPYVAFQDGSSGDNKVTVMKYDGSSAWTIVGTAKFTPATAAGSRLSFVIDHSGTPYLAFQGSLRSVSVLRFDGTNWVAAGAAGLGFDYFPRLTFDKTGALFLCSNGTWVMKFDGAQWKSLPYLPLGQTFYDPSLAFTSDNTPYLQGTDVDGKMQGLWLDKGGFKWIPHHAQEGTYYSQSIAIDRNDRVYKMGNDGRGKIALLASPLPSGGNGSVTLRAAYQILPMP